MWKKFCNAFNMLPVAALVEDRILCMHGGLSKDMKSLDEIKQIQRPTKVPDQGVLCDLLWSDPTPFDGDTASQFNVIPKEWGVNERGVSYIFSEKVVEQLVKKYDMVAVRPKA